MLARLRTLFARPPFDPSPYRNMTISAATETETATFAAGCFWGVEHIFLKHFPPAAGRVLRTAVGYTGGRADADSPDYRTVCSGATGHAEAVNIVFDPARVAYAELVEFFFRVHDPTTVDRQGGDVGTQYRSAIFTHSPAQAATAARVRDAVQAAHFTPAGRTIATQIAPAGPWWDAEEYHQLYLHKNPDGYQCASHRLHW